MVGHQLSTHSSSRSYADREPGLESGHISWVLGDVERDSAGGVLQGKELSKSSEKFHCLTTCPEWNQ